MKFESKSGPKRKKKNTHFVSWKDYSFLLFFTTPFPVHFKNDF